MKKRVAAVALGFVFLGAPASAQDRTGFAIDRYEPAERGSAFFFVDQLDLRGDKRPSFGATLAYAQKPLVVLDKSGEERFALVRHQTFLHLGGAVVLFDRVRAGLSLPLAVYQDGEDGVAAGDVLRGASAPAVGDVRLALDGRVLGRAGGPIAVAIGARAWLPTGLRSQFTSDGALRLGPQASLSSVLGPLVIATRVAFVYRARDDAYAGAPIGSELAGAVGGGLRFADGRLLIGPELSVATVVRDAFAKRATPAEVVIGVHWEVVRGLRIAIGGGPGISQGFGAPRLRLLAGVEWSEPMPAPPPPERNAARDEIEPLPPEDADHDGVLDVDDACPAVAGVRTSDPMTNGCPENAPRPLAIVAKGEIRIGEEIHFATDSAELLASSDAVLLAVKKLLDEHPEIHKVRIEGHTDDVGDPAYNDELSRRRAASVASFLASRGIDAARLESQGFGSRKPIASNDDEDGRARNRRVVFTIVEQAPAR